MARCALGPLLRRGLGAAALALLLPAGAARALEEVVVELPLMESSMRVRLAEFNSPEALLRGDSQLAELDRATDGRVGRALVALFNHRLPLSITKAASASVGSPLLEQALLIVSSFGTIEGHSDDITGQTLEQTLRRAVAAAPDGQPTLLQVMKAIPGKRARLNLSQAGVILNRVLQQRVLADRLLAEVPAAKPPVPPAPQRARPSTPGVVSNTVEIPVAHRPQPLALRPRDLTAVIDAIGKGSLATNSPVDSNRVVVIGHSWGATTSLLMAGLVPTDSLLLSRCGEVNHPDRNLSWTLQCSWASAVKQASINDDRIIAVVAVSAPMSLLFPRETDQRLNTRVLLVSGSRDWVVPPDPEAIQPLQGADLQGHQLVIAKGGDHFNLRPRSDAQGGVLGALMLAWTEAAFAAGAKVRPAPGVAPLLPPNGWGSATMPLADVSPVLPSRR